MIYWLLRRSHRYTVTGLLAKRAAHIANRIEVLHYEDLHEREALQPGTLVFMDLDRLDAPARRAAGRVGAYLQAHTALRVLNAPKTLLDREPLLRRLHADGLNRFAVRRLSEGLDGIRYPVFLRNARGHNLLLSELLDTPAELQAAVTAQRRRGLGPADILLIEFCDTADDSGTFTKYAAFMIDGEVLPRHVDFDTHWLVKSSNWLDDRHRRERHDEVARYFAENPHEGWLRQVFRIAGIQWGRADYGLLDGRPQLWEINTNPTFGGGARRRRHTPEEDAARALEEPFKQAFFTPFLNATERLAGAHGSPVSLAPVRTELQALAAGIEDDSAVEIVELADALRRARALAAASRFVDAGRICQRILEVVPRHVDTMLLLASILGERLGRQHDALRLLDTAAEQAPDRADVMLARANARLQAGRLDGALEDVARARHLAPTTPDARLLEARVLARLGRADDARTVLEALLRDDAHNQLARRLLDNLVR